MELGVEEYSAKEGLFSDTVTRINASELSRPVTEVEEFFERGNDPNTCQIVSKYAKMAIPSILYNLSFQIPFVANVLIGGRMNDPAKLAAIGIGGTTCAIVLISVLSGLNGAQATLASQAFGSNKLKLCGVYLNRGRFIQLAFSVPLCSLTFIYAEKLLLLIGQDPEVSRYAAEYMRWNLPGCLLAGQNHLMITWLLCMRYPTASMIIGVSTSILYVPIILFFVYFLDYGVASFGIAFSL